MEHFIGIRQLTPNVPNYEFITQYEKEIEPGDVRTFAGPLIYAEDWPSAEDFCSEFMPAVTVVGQTEEE